VSEGLDRRTLPLRESAERVEPLGVVDRQEASGGLDRFPGIPQFAVDLVEGPGRIEAPGVEGARASEVRERLPRLIGGAEVSAQTRVGG